MAGVTAVFAGYHAYQAYRNLSESSPTTQSRVTSSESSLDDQTTPENDPTEDGETSDDDDDAEQDDPDFFHAVKQALDLSALKRHAISTRFKLDRLNDKQVLEDLTCEIDNPTSGSFNLVFFITFADGVRWVARIPGKGTKFEEIDVNKMNQEYWTMRMLGARTTIPIPEVLMWDTSGSTIGVPFALSSFIPGSLLSKTWFALPEEGRLKVLDQIATHMSQLQQLKFDHVGGLRFDIDGQYVGGGPHHGYASNYLSTDVWEETRASGPWNSGRELLLWTWDCTDEKGPGTSREVDHEVVRFAIDSIPEHMYRRGENYLQHADFNFQNILVDSKGNITGIIDWDGADAMPASMGYARYPSWITRDWDPVMYGYDSDEKPPYDPTLENSPEELSRYRSHYAAVFERLNLPDYDPRETRFSHIMEAIEIAANSRFSRDWIVPLLLNHAFHGDVPFDYSEFAEQYLEGGGKDEVEMIKTAFAKMWTA